MDRIALKYPKLIIYGAYVGIVIGYIGMMIMVFIILKGFITLLTQPDAAPVVTPILPGIPIPGSPIFVPFWHGMIALFVVVVIHEFFHGVVSRAHKIHVKSSGFAMFAFLPAAFVEPDEKELIQRDKKTQLSIFAAGPFSNIILGALVFLIISFILPPIHDAVVEPIGFSFSTLVEDYPAIKSGLEKDVIYNQVDGKRIITNTEFIGALTNLKPKETVMIGNQENTYTIEATENPDNATKGYIGVYIEQRYKDEDKAYFKTMIWIFGLFVWIFILTLGLGLANLLPLGPVDGGRMLLIPLVYKFGEKRGRTIWAKISLFFIVMLIIMVFVPIIKAVLS